MYEKQKSLGNPIKLIGHDNKQMNQNAGKYVTSSRGCQRKFVAWLKENDLLEKEEEIIAQRGHVGQVRRCC